jgi:hypothetical protein
MQKLKSGLDPRSTVMNTRPKNRRESGRKKLAEIVTASGDRYLELVLENPLRNTHSEEEYQRAIAMLDRLSDRGNDRTADEAEYLLALAVFVEKYKEEHPRSRRFQASRCCGNWSRPTRKRSSKSLPERASPIRRSRRSSPASEAKRQAGQIAGSVFQGQVRGSSE